MSESVIRGILILEDKDVHSEVDLILEFVNSFVVCRMLINEQVVFLRISVIRNVLTVRFEAHGTVNITKFQTVR